VMGDMNVKVDSNNVGREFIMGKEGLGNMNENGELFTDLCGQKDLVIGGTIFPHKDIHKAAWTAPDMSVKNQIDHVAISRRWRRALTDVRDYQGADAGGDHELLIARLQVRIVSIRKSGMQTASNLLQTLKMAP